MELSAATLTISDVTIQDSKQGECWGTPEQTARPAVSPLLVPTACCGYTICGMELRSNTVLDTGSQSLQIF